MDQNAGIEVAEVAAPRPELARLFDEYREHYGERADPAASQAWLRQHMTSGALRAFLAVRGDEVAGFALVAPIPASQRLGLFWQLRDLFVAPRHRRIGVGEALLSSLCNAAVAHGAARLSLVTESDNAAALELYAKAGFEPVTGYASMSRSTRP
ncbi:MAG TPA: GNAT family N-acetyltransferase [Oryzihumus sp.]|nr:GNAT family N-acetyltransferase [Oryzihumus sp.]